MFSIAIVPGAVKSLKKIPKPQNSLGMPLLPCTEPVEVEEGFW
jgi:hypothetical protein